MERPKRYWAHWPATVDLVGEWADGLRVSVAWKASLCPTRKVAALLGSERSKIDRLSVLVVEEKAGPSWLVSGCLGCLSWWVEKEVWLCHWGVPYRRID